MAGKKQKPKTIVLLHGYLSSSKYWSKLEPYLVEQGYNVIKIDLLGFGEALKPRNVEYSYNDHAEYVGEQINLRTKGPFVLVGHSMGALIALRYSINNEPDKLILLNPPLYKSSEQARSTLMSTNVFYRLIIYSKFKRFVWRYLKLIRHPYIGEHSYLAREKSLENVIEKAEIFSDLEKNKVDTLLFVGSKDRKVYMDNLENIKLNINISLVVEDVDHHAPAKRPDIVSKAMLKFLD